MQVCIDFGGSAVKIATADAARLIDSDELPLRGDASDLERVGLAATQLAGGAGVDGVAIAVPGLLDAEGCRMLEAHGKYEWMLGRDLVAWSLATFGAPALVDVDARAALRGETSSGCARHERDVVLLVLGTGIGTAAMVDGVIMRGVRGSAGVLGGHVTIDREGPECNCGNVGCAEVYGGSWALPARIRAHRARGIRGEVDGTGGFAALLAAAERGDALARAVRDDAVRAWGACAVTMCHLFDPSAAVIAGGVAHAAPAFASDISRYLDEHLWASLARPRLLVASDPQRSVLRGLAAQAAEL